MLRVHCVHNIHHNDRSRLRFSWNRNRRWHHDVLLFTPGCESLQAQAAHAAWGVESAALPLDQGEDCGVFLPGGHTHLRRLPRDYAIAGLGKIVGHSAQPSPIPQR